MLLLKLELTSVYRERPAVGTPVGSGVLMQEHPVSPVPKAAKTLGHPLPDPPRGDQGLCQGSLIAC